MVERKCHDDNQKNKLCFLATNCAKRYARGIATNYYSSIMSGVVSFPDMRNAFATLGLLSIANSGQMVLKLREEGGLAGFDLRQSTDAENQ
jgi:hypothetical protein